MKTWRHRIEASSARSVRSSADVPESTPASEHGGPAAASVRTHVVVGIDALVDARIGDAIRLDSEALHHLLRVLRIRSGDRITLTDGAGRWCEAGIDGSFDPGGSVTVASAVVAVPEPGDTGVAFALTKGEKPETVIQKLTELGIRRIVPVQAERSVVQWDADKADRNRERWDIVARNALEQSRGVWLPIIEPVQTVAELAARTGVVRADRGGRNLKPDDSLIAIGPEGGWSPAERDLLHDAVGLPGQVLRAETAAIVAGALLVDLPRSGRSTPSRST